MTYEELKAEKTDFDPHQLILEAGITKGKYTVPLGGDIRDIYIVKAKDDLRADLQDALGLNPQSDADNTELDAIVEYQQLILRRALAQKQLNLALLRLSTNPDSKRYIDALNAGKEYSQIVRGFPGLRRADGVSTVRIIDSM